MTIVRYQMNNVLDRFEIIKQIGKGSFSNVYLCKIKEPNGYMDVLFGYTDDVEEYFIIKEININVLVKKYVTTSVAERVRTRISQKNTTSPLTTNLTPFNRNNENKRSLEDEYYFKRLRELIESEIEVLYMLDHKNIIKFLDHGHYNGVYYLHMEYCELGDVYEMMKKIEKKDMNVWGGINKQFIYKFVEQMVDAFLYLAQKNIIHRDVKLHNVLLRKDKDGQIVCKLSDFGFSCFDVSELSHDLHLTNSWHLDEILTKKYFKLCGTPYYMAPEIILNMKMLEDFTQYAREKDSREPSNRLENKMATVDKFYNKKVDLWSLGICVYELIFNKLPFPNVKNIKDLDTFFNNNPQKYIDEKIKVVEKFDKPIADVLRMLLCVDPKERKTITQVHDFIKTSFVLKEHIQHEPLNRKDSFMSQSRLQKHIVSSPVHEDPTLTDSWVKIHESGSMIMKMSIDKGFLDWLMTKK